MTKMVLVSLAYRTNGKPVCWPSLATIAVDCGIDRKNVPRYIRQLASANLIVVTKRTLKGALSNEYVLTMRTPRPHTESDVSSDRGQGVSSQRPTNLEVRKEEEDSEATPLPPVDPVKEIFDRGLKILGGTHRSLLGKMRQSHGDEAVLDAILACEAEGPSEPVAFFIGCLKRAPPARNGHDRESPVTKLYKGAMRAADKLDREEADRRDGVAPLVPLLDRR